jgi:hypothetical protein
VSRAGPSQSGLAPQPEVRHPLLDGPEAHSEFSGFRLVPGNQWQARVELRTRFAVACQLGAAPSVTCQDLPDVSGALQDGGPFRFRQLGQNYVRRFIGVVRARSRQIGDNPPARS